MDGWAFALSMLTGLLVVACASPTSHEREPGSFTLDYSTPTDSLLQNALTGIDGRLRQKYGMSRDQVAVGVLDLRKGRLAMLEPDRLFYGASVPKIAILLAYFAKHPQFATNLPAETRHELGLMIKRSSNELAAKYSQELGLTNIRTALEKYGFYDANRGGGIWVGKHYGVTGERIGDPVGDHSHAATLRQLLRFCLLLEQGRLVSPEASSTMIEIFRSPDIRHEKNKFVEGLEGFPVEVLRKSGSWEDWLHDLAIVKGDRQHYILTGLTRHPQGDEFLSDFARAVHEELKR